MLVWLFDVFQMFSMFLKGFSVFVVWLCKMFLAFHFLGLPCVFRAFFFNVMCVFGGFSLLFSNVVVCL